MSEESKIHIEITVRESSEGFRLHFYGAEDGEVFANETLAKVFSTRPEAETAAKKLFARIAMQAPGSGGQS